MSDDAQEPEANTLPELVTDEVPSETVTEPAKVMRIGSMVKQLLEEVRGRQRAARATRVARSHDRTRAAAGPRQ